MGLWGGLKKIGKVAGKGLQLAAPVLGATGVGIPLAMAAGGAGGLLQGKGLKGAAFGALGGLAGGAAGKLAGLGGRLLGPKLSGALGSLTGPKGEAGSGALGFLGRLGLGRPGGLEARHLLLAGAGGLGLKAARDAAGRRDQYLQEAVGRNRAEYEAGVPARSAARAALLSRIQSGGAPAGGFDLSGLRDTANPFRSRFSFALPGANTPALLPPAPGGSAGATPPTGGGSPPPAEVGERLMPPAPTRRRPRRTRDAKFEEVRV